MKIESKYSTHVGLGSAWQRNGRYFVALVLTS